MLYGTRSPAYGRSTTVPAVPIVLYGTRWCAATQMVRRYLDRQGVPYRYVDLDADPRAQAQLRWWTGGSVSHPTVAIGGSVLVEPTIGELQWALSRVGV